MEKTFKQKTRIGDYGELIIQKYFDEQGISVYAPENKTKSNPLDKFFIDKEYNIFMGDMKVKSKRIYYQDTGIDLRHYYTYLNIKNKSKLPFYLYFIDPTLGTIYYNELGILNQSVLTPEFNYPVIIPSQKTRKTQIYFPLTSMIHLRDLTKDELIKIKELYGNV